MDVVQYLKRIELLGSKIANKTEEVLETMDYSTADASRLVEEISALRAEREEMVSVFEDLNKNEYNVMYSRYVLGRDYSQIASKADKSYSWVTTVHGNAKKKIRAILEARNGEEQQTEEEQKKGTNS